MDKKRRAPDPFGMPRQNANAKPPLSPLVPHCLTRHINELKLGERPSYGECGSGNAIAEGEPGSPRAELRGRSVAPILSDALVFFGATGDLAA
jgi:hypothetical protein